MVVPDVATQAALALPNAVNLVISFSVTVLGFVAVAERRESCLYIGAALVAVAVNMKFDAMLLGGVLGLAILLFGWPTGLAGFGRRILLSTAIFGLSLCLPTHRCRRTQVRFLSSMRPPAIQNPMVLLGVSAAKRNILAATARRNLKMLRAIYGNLIPWQTSRIPLGLIAIGLVVLATWSGALMHHRGTCLAALVIPTTAVRSGGSFRC